MEVTYFNKLYIYRIIIFITILQIYNSTVTPHQITLKDLQPETNYKLCGYFENQFKNATETQTCIEFLTGEWDLFTKVTI